MQKNGQRIFAKQVTKLLVQANLSRVIKHTLNMKHRPLSLQFG